MKEVTAVLVPTLDDEADFWARWTGSRFLGDQFSDRFRLECALLEALGGLLANEAAGTLAAARTALKRTADDLGDAGRRRDTAMLTARLARQFIDQLALWCVEVELATREIAITELPRAARRLLAYMRTADALRR